MTDVDARALAREMLKEAAVDRKSNVYARELLRLGADALLSALEREPVTAEEVVRDAAFEEAAQIADDWCRLNNYPAGAWLIASAVREQKSAKKKLREEAAALNRAKHQEPS